MRVLNEPLVSNGYTLEMTQERLGWLEPTNADLPLEQLQKTYRQNGYLWLKGFFEREVILNFRYLGQPAVYQKVVLISPFINLMIMTVMFVIFLVVGTILFVRSERNK